MIEIRLENREITEYQDDRYKSLLMILSDNIEGSTLNEVLKNMTRSEREYFKHVLKVCYYDYLIIANQNISKKEVIDVLKL